MPDNEQTTDWDAASEVADVDIPEFPEEQTAAEKTFHQLIQNGVPVAKLLDKDGNVVEELRGDAIDAANEFTDKVVDAQVSALEGEPVSTSDEPIKLLDPQPEVLSVLHLNGVDVISTPDRIQVVKTGASLEPAPEPLPAPVQTERMRSKADAEQEAGRKALQRHAERAVQHPRPVKDAEEVRREGGSTAVFRPGDMNNVQQRVLATTPDPKKGQGY